MIQKRGKIIQWIALLACSVILFQIAVIIIKGDALCLNQGCQIVEKLTTISPFLFNVIGLLYFSAVVLVGRWFYGDSPPLHDWLRLLLLAGLAAEGVLVSYQLFVIQTLCSYCLFIFFLIFLLNIVHGFQQALIGSLVFLSVLGAFAVLNFGPTLVVLRNQSLATGSFAIKRCVEPVKQLYLFFSSDCPHCNNVLSALESCNSCEFHFNPIDRIQTLGLPELEYTYDYEPALNRLILSLMGIETIPVLLVVNADGFTFIKGEESITRYISQACFRDNPLLYMDSSQYSEAEGISIYDKQDGDCEIEIECPEPEGQSENPSEERSTN